MTVIQWYPGHIAKVERQLTELLKLVDVVIEVIDARLPISTINPRLRKRYTHKPVLLLLNKADLADPAQNKRWREHYKGEANAVMLYESLHGKQRKQLLDTLLRLGEEKMKALEAQGRKRRPIRVLVVGMPNVGKSTIINSIVGRKKAKTGHKAGVTRQTQWVRIHPAIELMDTPGVIPPRLDSEESGSLLASVSSVGEAAYEEEPVARFLLERIETLHPNAMREYYKLSPDQPLTLESVAENRHYVITGGEPDCLRAARSVLSEFRQGRPGRLTLEHAPAQDTEGEKESGEEAQQAEPPAGL